VQIRSREKLTGDAAGFDFFHDLQGRSCESYRTTSRDGETNPTY
jgi:hypothetical protein